MTAAGAPGGGEAAPGKPGPGRRVRVLWLAKGLGRGGAERLLVNCARHRDRSRFDIEAAYLLPWKDALAPALRASGMPVHCVGGDVWWPARLARLLAAGRYDVVHTHMPVPAVAARVLARPSLTGRRSVLVHTEHNVWERYRPATRWANALTYRRNAAVVAVSAAVADSVRPGRLRDRGAGGVLSVVHHGPDLGAVRRGPEARAAARSALGLPPDAAGPVLGCVASFTPKKDHTTLLAAFGRLREAWPEARLVLIGAGPLDAEVRAAAARFRGAVLVAGARDDVPALLPALDVFVLSSLQEGLPVALMEAMATGLPSVLTRVGGVPEAVDDGVEGLLVEPGRPGDLAEALGLLAADPDLRAAMGKAARARAEHFDARTAQHTIESLYLSALHP